MKIVLILISVFFGVTIFNAQTVTSSCVAPDSIVWKYRTDADKMEGRRIYVKNSTYKDSIGLNKTSRDHYLRDLIAVYNATALPARDSVVNLYNIHMYNPILNTIQVRADSNLTWMKNVRANIFPSGCSTIDCLMTKFWFKKSYYSNVPFSPNASLVLITDTNCNTDKAAEIVRAIPGVTIASSNHYMGEGNNIEDSLTSTYTWLVYSYGWHDCYNGCYFRRFWQFRVHNDCSVEYGGSFGTPLTVDLKENVLNHGNIKVFPNPGRVFTVTNTLGGTVNVRVINMLGAVVHEQQLPIYDQQLDFRQLAPGPYFLILQAANGIETKKIIVE